jgi:hypothetical protein
VAYRNLSKEQFSVVKDAAKKVCDDNGLKTIGDFKQVGNKIIDEIEAGNLTFADLLQPVINYNPPAED